MTLVTVDARDFNPEGPATDLVKGVYVSPLSVRNIDGVLVSQGRELITLGGAPATLSLPTGHYRFAGVGGTSIPSRTVFVPDTTAISLAELYESYTVDPETLTADAPPDWVVQLQSAVQRIHQLEASLGIDPFVMVDNGDGTVTFLGSPVTDFNDGTFSLNDVVSVDNGDGTFTLL